MSGIHEVRDRFNLETFLEARKLTIGAVKEIQSRVFTGMTEKDGDEIIDEILKELGITKKWHPNKFRIGRNTTKSFRDQSEEGMTLQEIDIFFVDIGPVWSDHEGDYGETFIVGDSDKYLDISNACKKVFEKTERKWREEDLSGAELYRFAKIYADELGYELNDRMKGHRIGDFPHHLCYRGGLSDINETPSDHLWVLEIHLVSRDNKYGAFFEDILRKGF